MKSYKPSRFGGPVLLGLSLSISATVQADQFIGFGQPGVPGSFALESFPVYNRTSQGDDRAGANTVLAYFSETGFTGTTRDQIEVWGGAIAGYADTNGAKDSNEWGFASPNIGLEYYYNVIEPKSTATYASPDYFTFWTSPTLMVEFPNGNDDAVGFGAGSNRYAVNFSVNNYVQYGKFAATFTPVGVYYAARNRSDTDLGNGTSERLRGGVSYWFADIAAGYLVTDNLWLGVHHVYNLNNRSSTDFEESREGKIGPSMTYTGFAKQGVYISANLNFDYYHSDNIPYSNSFTMALVKSF
ncbi:MULTISPECIES: hypothetical protein [unclassified Pseudomonas]|uniref:hypothetical protein n=1 Tax=unclassified Pseudomonas TaxID=196821 RepID=UPI000BA3BA15|nr:MULTISPECIES: hypothetical protein [unclassified Pseudomonas]